MFRVTLNEDPMKKYRSNGQHSWNSNDSVPSDSYLLTAALNGSSRAWVCETFHMSFEKKFERLQSPYGHFSVDPVVRSHIILLSSILYIRLLGFFSKCQSYLKILICGIKIHLIFSRSGCSRINKYLSGACGILVALTVPTKQEEVEGWPLPFGVGRDENINCCRCEVCYTLS